MSKAPSQPAFPTEPAWDIARLYTNQGAWSTEEYLALDTNHLVEYSHGYIEVLPMPTMSHQLIAAFLYQALQDFVRARQLGLVLFAPLPVQLWAGKFREPDLVFMRTEHAERMGNAFWEGADLVIEVVSDANRHHDLETKRREYAQAGIPEYWIVDPMMARITVLRLDGPSYAVHGEFSRGEIATSALLPGFAVAVSDALEAKP